MRSDMMRSNKMLTGEQKASSGKCQTCGGQGTVKRADGKGEVACHDCRGTGEAGAKQPYQTK